MNYIYSKKDSNYFKNQEPKKTTIEFILNYSKSIKVIKSKFLETVIVTNN